MNSEDLGGEAACRAHELEEPGAPDVVRPLVLDLATLGPGSGGAIWSLPHGGDLDANVVRLGSGDRIEAHTNDEVDVVMFVQAGSGELTIDDTVRDVASDHLVLVPRGTRRSVQAGASGITYLSIHRRRGPLGISPKPGGADGQASPPGSQSVTA